MTNFTEALSVKAEDKKNYFAKTIFKIQEGLLGKNVGIETPFSYLNNFFLIREGLYTLLFGHPGGGKSAYAHQAFILHPVEMLFENRLNRDLAINFFLMERKMEYVYSKWIANRIFKKEGVNIPVEKMLRWRKESFLNQDELNLIKSQKDFFLTLDKVTTIHQGPKTPQYILENCVKFSNHYGKDVLKIAIIDTMNIVDQSGAYTKKQAIDNLSKVIRFLRDEHGFFICLIAQTNRDTSALVYTEKDKKYVDATSDALKDSGSPVEDADCVFSLINPMKYNAEDRYYDIKKFSDDERGLRMFRSFKILKNSWGKEEIHIGYVFEGNTGMFKELPSPRKVESWTDMDFQFVLNGDYFIYDHTEKKVSYDYTTSLSGEGSNAGDELF